MRGGRLRDTTPPPQISCRNTVCDTPVIPFQFLSSNLPPQRVYACATLCLLGVPHTPGTQPRQVSRPSPIHTSMLSVTPRHPHLHICTCATQSKSQLTVHAPKPPPCLLAQTCFFNLPLANHTPTHNVPTRHPSMHATQKNSRSCELTGPNQCQTTTQTPLSCALRTHSQQ